MILLLKKIKIGNSLLDCVVFGRVSGRNASKYLFSNILNAITSMKM